MALLALYDSGRRFINVADCYCAVSKATGVNTYFASHILSRRFFKNRMMIATRIKIKIR